MSKGYSTETFMRVYDNDHGYFYEIRPDADGFDCVAIFYSDGGKGDKVEQQTAMPPEMARHVARAMLAVADAIDKEKAK
jgi:hypothetical protein